MSWTSFLTVLRHEKMKRTLKFSLFILNYNKLWQKCLLISDTFVGSVYRTETMHQLLRFKSKFSNHFAFTLGRYFFLLFLVHFI